MYRLILVWFTVMTTVSAIPADAASAEQRSLWSFNDILDEGNRLLMETITQGLAIIQDRIEMDAITTPSPDGEESTHLRLKLFPNGKSRPDDAMSVEGIFRRFPDREHFGFDFRIVTPKHKADPKEYI